MPDDNAEQKQDDAAPIEPEELDQVAGGALNAYEGTSPNEPAETWTWTKGG
jgi:hypothetical protein